MMRPILTAALLAATLFLPGRAAVQDTILRDFRLVRACAADVWSLCGDVPPGEGRIKACMKQNFDKLSAGCVDAMLSAAAAARETPQMRPVPIPAKPAEHTYRNLRGVIYCEVWLFRNTPKGIAGVYYNTSELNNAADQMNTCPAAMWEKVTVPALEATFDVLAAYRNGPRGWTMDWIRLPVGPVETFEGLQARWMGQGLLPKGVALTQAHMTPYSPLQSHRKSEMVFEKGKPVFILEDKDGVPWVMQAFSQILDPGLTYDTLKDLGAKLKPAPGWKFRVAVLDRQLVISTPRGYNWIVQDELQNTYDACKEGACNFRP